MLWLMFSKDSEDRIVKKRKPYNRAVEKRLYFQEYIASSDKA